MKIACYLLREDPQRTRMTADSTYRFLGKNNDVYEPLEVNGCGKSHGHCHFVSSLGK